MPAQPDKSVRSNTSVCLSLSDVDADGVKKMASLLESNKVALDIGKSDPHPNVHEPTLTLQSTLTLTLTCQP